MSEGLLSLMLVPLFEYTPVAKDTVEGFIVSTIFAGDKELFETAIKDKGGFHPVETYTGREEALVGHARWVAFIVGGNRQVVELSYGDVVDPESVILTL